MKICESCHRKGKVWMFLCHFPLLCHDSWILRLFFKPLFPFLIPFYFMAFYQCSMEISTKEFSVKEFSFLENSFHGIFLFLEPSFFPGILIFMEYFFHGICFHSIFFLKFSFMKKKFTENSCSPLLASDLHAYQQL